MAVTLKQVAEGAGVSPQTVSNVLNKSLLVKPSTRARVEEVIEQLGYEPNFAARSLRRSHTRTLACILYQRTPEPEPDPYAALVQASISTAARAAKHDLLIHTLLSGEPGELRVLEAMFTQRRIDGAVLLASDLPDDVLGLLAAWPHPVVLLDRDAPESGLPYVAATYAEGVRAAVRHVHGRGRQRIAFVGGPPQPLNRGAQSRLTGYHAGMRECGLDVEEGYVVAGDWGYASGAAALRQLFELPEPPDAVVAANDRMALGALHAARALGLRLPHDLAVTGFGDLDFARYLHPALTTVDLPVQDMARAAVQLLLNAVAGEVKSVTHRVLPTRLVVRQSA
ncbi:DNA-binding transcriptional regulator CytR (plasmid) [Deinococcus aetherius]|uniref:DNA-binding transcriptional regulator CytR n=1 Tax=Deinococcus aetherius TaxID=200252 RepID=A0ABM8AKS1_9DEIO|nr:DNA-binding transcriptional regulator CytR [Deinococcus aetherius]